jgi:poly(3-hydroxybutyrate) depolymerase
MLISSTFHSIGRRAGLWLGVALLAASTPVFGADEAATPVERAHFALLERLAAAKHFLGNDIANDVIVRLGDDKDYRAADRPADYPAADWDETVANIVRLDTALVDQAISETAQPLGAIRGLGETFVLSAKDGTHQPIAVYVPSSYDPAKPAALAIALHGRPQTETELLAPPPLRRLAEASGTILIAPWGRGNYDFAEPAGSEVYDVVDAAEHAFAIDSKRVFLVGYSMGGFSVFKVGPLHAERWKGVMSIAGAVVNSETDEVVRRFSRLNVYVVNGGDDASVPAKYGAQTADFLAHAGISVGFYQEPHGTHALRTLNRVLAQAWNDMLAGKVHMDRLPVTGPGIVAPPPLGHKAMPG